MKSLTLTIASGPRAGVKTTIQSGQSICVGRGPSADLSVVDPLMSREHFQLTCQRDECLVRDLHSRHGTRINGRNALPSASLRDGDQIAAGCTLFEVRIDDNSSQD